MSEEELWRQEGHKMVEAIVRDWTERYLYIVKFVEKTFNDFK